VPFLARGETFQDSLQRLGGFFIALLQKQNSGRHEAMLFGNVLLHGLERR
jgi:hypothetical protein